MAKIRKSVRKRATTTTRKTVRRAAAPGRKTTTRRKTPTRRKTTSARYNEFEAEGGRYMNRDFEEGSMRGQRSPRYEESQRAGRYGSQEERGYGTSQRGGRSTREERQPRRYEDQYESGQKGFESGRRGEGAFWNERDVESYGQESSGFKQGRQNERNKYETYEDKERFRKRAANE